MDWKLVLRSMEELSGGRARITGMEGVGSTRPALIIKVDSPIFSNRRQVEFRLTFPTTRRTRFVEVLTPLEDLATVHPINARALRALTRWRATSDQGGIQALITGLGTMCQKRLTRLPANASSPAEWVAVWAEAERSEAPAPTAPSAARLAMDAEAEWQLERQRLIKELEKKELKWLKAKSQASDADFVLFLQQTFPPNKVTKMTTVTTCQSGMKMRTTLIKSIALYHPDKINADECGKKYKVLCEEITKELTKRLESRKA